ncbi:glycosyltransferase [Phenylobacterium sp. LjRoot219]|uniref:glycosyltransferase n=1 Tax=Phenylobacterium sp. LjRoot219 TaxID=3342283 RepID=UPI003ECEBFF9
MRHLIISRELPPASYPAGGIGTYVANIAKLLAKTGDTVHLIGERWDGAPKAREAHLDGRMIVHRIGPSDIPIANPSQGARMKRELQGLRETVFPNQWFAWSAALLAERLVEEEGIDLIEAQEWEAPLYFFLLRRSLGLGPDQRPPCVVHLHSPSVFIHKFNGPARPRANLETLRRMEEFCIKSADALLCPSGGLARAAARHYRLQPDSIEVIPLPLGDAPRIERDFAVWSEGSICYVGRLEPRKGVIEWVEAATRVAQKDAAVHFDFVGADSWNLQQDLLKQIGPELAPRFRFHGARSKSEIAHYLGRAQAAVVPSRWENFPNVCIEAMASGLPVIATRNGAMAELLEDERSGWLAEDAGVAGMVDSLAEALRRCLATPGARKATMGAAAARTARRICDNDAVLAAHERFRSRVAARGAIRLFAPRAAPDASANVVVCAETLLVAKGVLRSLQMQTKAPKAIAVVYRQPTPAAWLSGLQLGAGVEVVLEHAPHCVGTQGWNHGFTVLAARQASDFWLFLDEHDLLEPDCIERMAGVFSSRPDVGVVTPWTDRTGPCRGFDARPSPALPYQMAANDVAPASGFRADALHPCPPFRPGLPREYDIWALANEAIVGGWTAVTLPGLYARREAPPATLSWLQATSLRAIRAEALTAFDSDENELALQLVDAYVPVPQPPKEAPNDQRLRRYFLEKLEAVLLRPGHVMRRCVGMVSGISRGASSP